MGQISVMIVDDHSLFRNGMRLLLSNTPDIKVVGEADNGKKFLDSLENIKPDIVLMDIDMPVMDGIEAATQALQIFPDIRIITLSMYGDEEYYYKMINAGAKGFLLKNSDIDELTGAIRTVYEGGNYFSEELLLNLVKNIKATSIRHDQAAVLSERETEVLQKICLGLSNNEIAEILHISKRTVDKHRANLLEKTNSRNTANLVIYAIKHKLIEL